VHRALTCASGPTSPIMSPLTTGHSLSGNSFDSLFGQLHATRPWPHMNHASAHPKGVAESGDASI